MRRLFMFLVIVAALGGGGALWWLNQGLATSTDTVDLAIEPGTLPRDVAQAVVNAGVQVNPLLLYGWFRFSGEARQSFSTHQHTQAVGLEQPLDEMSLSDVVSLEDRRKILSMLYTGGKTYRLPVFSEVEPGFDDELVSVSDVDDLLKGSVGKLAVH